MAFATAQDYRRIRAALRFVTDHPTAGKHFFVHSGTGTDAAGYGTTPDAPFASLSYAFSSDVLTASKDDVVHLLPYHNESIGNAQVTLDIAGVTVIGHGQGASRPRVDFDHANASIDITASNIKIKNVRLLPSVTAVAIGIDVNAAATDTVLEDIEILPGEDGAGVDEFTLGVDLKAGCDRTVIRRLKARQHASAAGCDAVISLTGASDDVTIEDCDLVCLGTAAVAPIKGITTLSTHVRILRNVLVSDDEPGIELLTGTTGVIALNSIMSNLATIAAAIVADGCGFFENYYVEQGNERGAIIGTASADD